VCQPDVRAWALSDIKDDERKMEMQEKNNESADFFACAKYPARKKPAQGGSASARRAKISWLPGPPPSRMGANRNEKRRQCPKPFNKSAS
jgi:hypothetical protein